jgi:hypothetical protein
VSQRKTGEVAAWAREEMATAQLHDERLNERLTRLLSDLGDRPTASIPAACGGYAEMMAAYRFFDNPKVTAAQILEPHYAATRQRLAAQPVVLLVQDTTEGDLTRPHQQVVGAGPLDGGTRRGVFVHPVAAFTPDGTPLGTVALQFWAREESAPDPAPPSRNRPIEEKESFRWVQGLRTARDVAQELPPTQVVCIADSDADVYEVFAEPRGERPVDWLIRACRDRCVAGEADAPHPKLYESVMAQPVLFTQPITVRMRDPKLSCEKRPRRVGRVTRTATVHVRAASVTLHPPRRPGGVILPPVVVNVVLVSEPYPPAGQPAVEWLLVTTLPISTLDHVRQIVQYYRVRWMIEILFRTWKSGCRVEERRFECLDRLLPCLAVYWIVAWRVLLVCRLGRSCPDVDCEVLFDPAEWQSVWRVTQTAPVPRQPPRLGVMVRLIAQLGGYVNRSNRADPPGPQTVWLGLQRMKDLAWAWNIFGPGANADPNDPEDV